MRIRGMLRRAFPSVTEISNSGYLLKFALDPLFPLHIPLRTRLYPASRAFAGLSQHGEKATSSLSSQNAAPPSTPDFGGSLMKTMMGSYSRMWRDGWTKVLCMLSSERDEGPKHSELRNLFGDKIFLSTGRVGTIDRLNRQYRLQKYGNKEGCKSWKLTNAISGIGTGSSHSRAYSSDGANGAPDKFPAPEIQDHSQRAVVMALCCNFLVFSLKSGVWVMTTSHVMLAEAVHSLADLANQALLAYGLVSSRRAPDDLHPYGYSKERFVWSLISAVGIFCLGSGATIVDGFSNLWRAELPDNIYMAAMVLAGSMIIEGASLLVAISAVQKGASAEGMNLWDYCWRGHDPTAVAVMMEDGAAVTGLVIAGMSLVAVSVTGNPIYDPIGSIFVGNLLGMVAIFLIQRNRHALIGRAMDNQDMKRVLDFLSSDPVVDAVHDCKSEVIGPRSYRFKAEIDFNGVVIVQNYLKRIGREAWTNKFREAVNDSDGRALDHVMSYYGEEVVSALGSEVDRLEREIQRLVPGIRHVDIETHNPNGPPPF